MIKEAGPQKSGILLFAHDLRVSHFINPLISVVLILQGVIN
jgi:hypothetical protein